jgi:glycosyltransferase involved in cell wall biosynthesis
MVMKNVFIVTTFKIYEGNSAGSVRLMNIAKALVSEETRVFLCSAVLSDSIDPTNVSEISRNIFLVGREKIKQSSFLQKNRKRFFNFFIISVFMRNIHKFIRGIEGEKVIYYYPDTEFSMDVLVLFYFKLLKRHNIYADINELRRTMLQNQRYSNKLVKRIYQTFSFSLYYFKYIIGEYITKYFDGLVVISTNLEKYFSRYNPILLRVPILSDCLGNNKITSLRCDDGRFQIGFTGILSTKKEGFEIFYQSLSIVKNHFDNFQLNLYGPIYEQYERELLLNILPQRYGLVENVKYCGNIEHKYILDVLKMQHLLVLPRPLNPQTHYGFSTKLSEYLVSGVPVFVTDVSDNALFIKDQENGFITNAGDPDAYANKILFIIRNYDSIVDKVSFNALETARKYFYYENYRLPLIKFLFNESYYK